MAQHIVIDGATVRMGGKEWIVPSLSFGQLRKLMPKINSLSSLGATLTDQQMTDISDIVHSALTRNYPELTRSEVEDMLDMVNMQTVIRVVTGQAGLVAKGEATAGES